MHRPFSKRRRRLPLRQLLLLGSAASLVWAGCRVRRDAPEGPAAGLIVAPVASFLQREQIAVRDAGPDGDPLVDAGDPPEGSFVLVFGGLDSAPERPQSEHRAVRIALAALAQGKSPVDAAVEGVAVLEDDPERNAGLGSSIRIDGVTVQMDAAVMTEDGRFGAVAALSRVRNPVRVARGVFDTDQRVLTGLGAQQFARGLGYADFDPVTAQAKSTYQALLAAELARDAGSSSLLPKGWQMWVDASAWLADGGAEVAEADAAADAALAVDDPADAAPEAAATPPPAPPKPPPKMPGPKAPAFAGDASVPSAPGGHDTVAALVRSAAGGFAGAVSSGGPPLTLPGRVGDVPTPGAALWVGKRGAVAITGPGERIVDLGLARAVYERLVALRSTKLAAAWGAKQLPAGAAVSVAVVDGRSFAVEPADAMAWVGSEGDKTSESATERKP